MCLCGPIVQRLAGHGAVQARQAVARDRQSHAQPQRLIVELLHAEEHLRHAACITYQCVVVPNPHVAILHRPTACGASTLMYAD